MDTKQALIEAMETAKADNHQIIARELGSLLNRFFRSKETYQLVANTVNPKVVIGATKGRNFVPYVPGITTTKKQKVSASGAADDTIVAEKDAPITVTTSLDDPEMAMIEMAEMSVQEIKVLFTSIQMFKDYTEKHYGVKYGSARNSTKVLDIFKAHVSD